MNIDPIIVVHKGGIIIFADGRVIFPHKDPPENPQVLGEIAQLATAMYHVAKLNDSKYRAVTLEYLNSAMEEKTKGLSAV
jgi:hypothetical protein